MVRVAGSTRERDMCPPIGHPSRLPPSSIVTHGRASRSGRTRVRSGSCALVDGSRVHHRGPLGSLSRHQSHLQHWPREPKPVGQELFAPFARRLNLSSSSSRPAQRHGYRTASRPPALAEFGLLPIWPAPLVAGALPERGLPADRGAARGSHTRTRRLSETARGIRSTPSRALRAGSAALRMRPDRPVPHATAASEAPGQAMWSCLSAQTRIAVVRKPEDVTST